MKLLCISDTHGLHNKIPKEWMVEADVLIHAGDICGRGALREVKQFLDWFNSFKQYKSKIFIAGNHDGCFQTHPNEIKELLKQYPSIIYLQDSEILIEGIKFYGSPWQPEFNQWAFNLPRGEKIAEKWSLIPKDTDVLITHGPTYGIGDYVPYKGGEFVGCKDLSNTVFAKLTQLKAHIYGHIHFSYGKVDNSCKQFINASVCNESYMVVNEPILIEL